MAKHREPLKVLLTAGPTRAYLDRVRFLSNFSTGELGFLTSKKLTENGVEVFAVVGPCHYPFEKLKLKKLFRVETNEEMEAAVRNILRTEKPAWGIFSAAVLDFKPRRSGKGKTTSKKSWSIELVPTRKIVEGISKEFPHLKKVGFKLEWKRPTGNKLAEFGGGLLRTKKYDRLVVNFLPDIKSKQDHKAYLFSNLEKKYKKAKDKLEIANWIAEQIIG